MRIAVAQISVARSDIEENLTTLTRMISEAALGGAESIFFPEMCSTGFDWNYNQSVLGDAQHVIEELQACAKASAVAVSGSFLEKTESGRAANTLYYIERDGSIVAKYRKAHLFTLFNEQTHVEAGNSIVVADTEMGKLGCSICYDLRFPELFRSCMNKGAIIQFLPAAFPHPRLAHWQTLIRARAIENQSFFIAVNQCGSEAHGSAVGDVAYFGHSSVVDPWGEIIYEADDSEGLRFVDIDLELVEVARSKLPALRDRRFEF